MLRRTTLLKRCSLPFVLQRSVFNSAGSRRPSRVFAEFGPVDGAALWGSAPISDEDFIECDAFSAVALYKSMLLCKSGTLWKDSVANFYLHGAQFCIQLARDLALDTYKPSKPVKFTLTYPKKRPCCSISFKDRVYQRSLNDNIIYPLMSKPLITSNCACQKGKGTDFARALLSKYLHNFWHNHVTSGYVLQLDIRGYYPNMQHTLVKEAFKKYLPNNVYLQVCRILDFQYPGECGFDPGSQLVQIAGISVLSPFDHFIKEDLHAPYYIRYMDDEIILCTTKRQAEMYLKSITLFLQNIGYMLNPTKTRIYPLTERIPWLGFTFDLRPDGAVIKRIKPAKVRQEKRKLRRMVKLSKSGNMPRDKCDECFRDWLGYIRHNCTGRATVQKMQKFYSTLWR